MLAITSVVLELVNVRFRETFPECLAWSPGCGKQIEIAVCMQYSSTCGLRLCALTRTISGSLLDSQVISSATSWGWSDSSLCLAAQVWGACSVGCIQLLKCSRKSYAPLSNSFCEKIHTLAKCFSLYEGNFVRRWWPAVPCSSLFPLYPVWGQFDQMLWYTDQTYVILLSPLLRWACIDHTNQPITPMLLAASSHALQQPNMKFRLILKINQHLLWKCWHLSYCSCCVSSFIRKCWRRIHNDTIDHSATPCIDSMII